MSEDPYKPDGLGERTREGMALPPWEERARFGLLNALYLTVKRVLLGPGLFFARMPTGLGLGQPLMFAVVMGILSSFFFWMWNLVGSPLEIGSHDDLPLVLRLSVLTTFNFIFAPLTTLVSVFLSAALSHLGLILFAGNRFGFEATFRVATYAHAVWLVVVIPFCGVVAAPFWWLAVLIIGLARIHDVDAWRAVLAVLLPLGFYLSTCGGLLFLRALAANF